MLAASEPDLQLALNVTEEYCNFMESKNYYS